MAGLLTAGIPALASAATTTTAHRTVTVTTTQSATSGATTTAHCKLSLSTQLPAHETSVLAGTDTGSQAGQNRCGSTGTGTTVDTFKTSAAGNLSGSIKHWFNKGTLSGTYLLDAQPTLGPPTVSNFAAESFAGKVTITGGTGSFAGVTGTGTMRCKTSNLAHFSCTETLKLTAPAMATTTTS